MAIIAGIVITGIKNKTETTNFRGGSGGQYARTCATSFSEATTTGHQLSKTILPAYGLRAWARVQIINNATNTTYVNFDEGTAATSLNGIPLGGAITGGATSTIQNIDFGLNTDFPYTGIVTALNNNGSSTIFITECRY